jgi:LysR family transcriptional activator of dmlA
VDNEPLLSDLRLFCLVARRGSFVAAAREAQASQTLVSKRVAVLEKSLGVKLLARTTRRVNVTDEGSKVFEWSQRILDHVEEMRSEISRDASEPRGAIRISSSARLGRVIVAPALSALKRRFPAVEIWLELLDRPVDLIGEGFHLDIRGGEANEPSLIGHRIAASSRILCAAPAYLQRHGMPRTPADLTRHECVLLRERSEPFGTWRLQNTQGARESAGVKVGGTLASNDYDVVLRWAHDGHGIVLGGDWVFTESLANGRLRRVLPHWHQPADIHAVSSLRSAQSAKVRLCVEMLKEQMGR